MRSGFLTKTIASTLIGLMGVNSLTWLPQAWASPGANSAISIPSYTLSLGIPNRGDIDAYHNAYKDRDLISNSLYLLRNTAIEDLLNTRRSLKVLLGGTANARRIAKDPNLGFEVPGGITDLYLLGDLGATARARPSQNSSSVDAQELALDLDTAIPAPIGSQQQSHGIDTDSVPAIAEPLHWLSKSKPEYDANLRGRLLMGLAFVSAQLVKYDQQLKFLERDFWEEPSIRNQFDREVLVPLRKSLKKMTGGKGNFMIGFDHYADLAKRSWLTGHEMDSVFAVLAGHREYLMDRYHLLGISVEGRPLYQRIYAEMEKLGFPSAQMVQPVVEKKLPSGSDPIPMPEAFEKALDAALGDISETSASLRFLSKLSEVGNAKVDNALLQSLRANTDRLADLAAQLHYDGSRSSPLLALARYEDLWDATISKFAYLEGVVDLQGAKKELREHWDRRDKTNRRIRYATFALAIGIGIAALAMTGGTAAAAASSAVEGGEAAIALLGIPLRSWIVGSGMIAEVGLSYSVYVDTKEKAKVAEGLYLSTKESASRADMINAIEMKESDFRFLVGSLVCMGFSSIQILKLAAVRNITMRAGQVFVKITNKEIAALKKGLGRIAIRAEVLAPLGRAMLAIARGTLGITVSQSRAMTLGDAIASVARQMKLSTAVVAARLEAAPGIGRLIKGWKVRQLSSQIIIEEELVKLAAGLVDSVPGSFAQRMITNQLRNAAISVVAERLARGEEMLGEQKAEFIGDMIRGSLITAVLTFNGQALRPGAEEAIYGTSRLNVKTEGFWASGAGQFTRNATSNAAWGMIINGSSSSAQELIQFARDDSKDAPSFSDRFWKVAKGTAWSGLTLGLSSTTRYTIFQNWVEPYIANSIKFRPLAKIVIQAAWTGNDLFGSWSYVHFGQKWKFLDGGDNEVDEYSPESSWNVRKLLVEETVPAYFKTDTDAVGAEYLFDFLREGEAAGPAPLIQ